MRDEDIERSFLEHLKNELSENKLPKTTGIHDPGDTFDPERFTEWIEPRIVSILRPRTNRRNEIVSTMVIQTRCFVKVQQKGKRQLELSCLVDRVRDVIDSTLEAPAASIRQSQTDELKNKGEVIGLIEFGPANETREYGVSILVDDVSVNGLDVATIETEAFLRGVC